MSRATGFPQAVRGIIIERAKGVCEVCGGVKPGMACHHRRPRAMGGSRRDDTNTASNGLFLCPDCHSHVESHRWLAMERGLLLRQRQSPLKEPVTLHGRRVWLTDDGGIELERAA